MNRPHSLSLRWTVHAVAILAACVLLVATAARAAARPGIPGSTTVNSTSGNTVANWSVFLGDAGVSACAGPKVESRMALTMNIAMHDALNAIAPDSPQIAFHGREPAAYPRAAVASAARTSLVEVLRAAPGLSTDCRRRSIAFVEEAAAVSTAALPDRPAIWTGMVLGKAAANAAVTWTGEHPART